MVIVTLLYDSEIWELTTKQVRRIEQAEMPLLRPLAGHSLRDHMKNEDIGTEFGMACINNTIQE